MKLNNIKYIISNNLRNISNIKSETIKILASGQRLHSASSDLMVSTQLSSNSRVLLQGNKNADSSLSILNIYDNALSELTNIVEKQNELALLASNTSTTNSQRVALTLEANSLVDEYNRIIDTTKFNNLNLLDTPDLELNTQVGYGEASSIKYFLNSEIDSTFGLGDFNAASNYTIGTNTYGIISDDFDNDGNLDLVGSIYLDNKINVILGNGDGSFDSPVTYTVANDPVGLASGDFNNDGNKDIVTANLTGTSISILLGNGDGTFNAASSAVGANNSRSVFASDFNNDGNLDLAFTNGVNHVVEVSFGNGDGTFGATTSYGAGVGLYDVTGADLNNDGIVDLMATSSSFSGNVSVLLGNADGTFQSAITLSAGQSSLNSTTADFNLDGNIDIVTTNLGDNSISVFLGNGNGTFNTHVTYSVNNPRDIKTGDFNSDGIQDLVTVNSDSNSLSLFIGNGDGSFQSQISYSPSGGSFSLVTADFNKDGVIDVATGNGNANTSILLSKTIQSVRQSYLNLTNPNSSLDELEKLNINLNKLRQEKGAVNGSIARHESAKEITKIHSLIFQAAADSINDINIAEQTAKLLATIILEETNTAILAQANLDKDIVSSLLT